MSLFGTLNTAVSGMTAQATYLSAISDNIANSSTTAYKEATTNFETQLDNQNAGTYTSSGVSTTRPSAALTRLTSHRSGASPSRHSRSSTNRSVPAARISATWSGHARLVKRPGAG